MRDELTGRELLERELLSRPVSSLQYMLRQLSRAYPFLPELVVDGVFGRRTLEAVMLFQREFHLPVTGVVDRETWNAIRDRWVALEREKGRSRSTRLFPSEGIRVEAGDDREYMILPQTMFQVLGRQFEGITADRPNGVHGAESVGNARWLQHAAGLPDTGVMDRATWNALSRLYELFVVKDLTDRPGFIGGWG